MTRYSAIHLSLLLVLSTYSMIAAIPIKEQVEQQRQNNIELRAVLESKENQLEELQQKNEILENLLITIEALRENGLLYGLKRATTTTKPRATLTTAKRSLTTVKHIDERVENMRNIIASIKPTAKHPYTTSSPLKVAP